MNDEGEGVASPKSESAVMREETSTKMGKEANQICQVQTRALRARKLPDGAMLPRNETMPTSIITEPFNPATAPAEYMALPITAIRMAPIKAGLVAPVVAEGKGKFEMRAGWNIA